MEAMIVGGGIGGLTAALFLHQANIRVRVFESAPEIKPLGVGINLLPPATRELLRLGLLDAVMEAGVELKSYCWFNKLGQKIHSEARGRELGFPWPQVAVHRGELHMLLLQTVRERLGAEAVQLDHHMVTFSQERGKVQAKFVHSGTGATSTHEADLMIAADGIHSVARKFFYPDEGPPRWNGNLMWRMCVELDEAPLGGNMMFSAGTRERKVVGYEVSGAAKRRGGALFNWIAEVRTGAVGDPPPLREDWSRRADFTEFLPYFAAFRFDWLDVPALAARSRAAWVYPMVDRDPVARWTFGRVSLLGDAAHPMAPIGSNGATQAIVDARALSVALTSEPTIERALEAYEAVRLPATTQVVHASRTAFHDRVLDLVEERAPGGFSRVDEVIEPSEIAALSAHYRQVTQLEKLRSEAAAEAVTPR